MSLEVIHNLDDVQLAGVVLSIGNFDGVHRGHQTIIAASRHRADRAAARMVAMTFEPHPATVLAPDRVPPVLTPLDEKLRLLEHAGAHAAVVVPSRPEFFRWTAEAFIQEVIVQRFRPAAVVEGASFRFGQHRQGDVDLLQSAGPQLGFEVEVVEPVRADLGGHPDTVISSSLVRHLLSSGNVDRAALCLGRPYTLIGTVTPGAARGRTLGFATANLDVGSQLVPAEGVYAGRTPLGDRVVPAAVSIGRTPTFDDHSLLIEAHLLDFQGDLYGQTLRLDLLEWLRPQHRFDTPEALQRQIADDITRVRSAIQTCPYAADTPSRV